MMDVTTTIAWEVVRLRDENECLRAELVRHAAIERAAWAVKWSFEAIGQDRTGLVQWTVDAEAMKDLIIALGPLPARGGTEGADE